LIIIKEIIKKLHYKNNKERAKDPLPMLKMRPKRPNLNPVIQFTGSVVLTFLLVIIVD
jgi:hypothetical protein